MLLSSALQLFSHRWYETVSIAEICRHAGLSNGVFYRYFRSKESIFKELSERFLASFREDLNGCTGPTVSARLQKFLRIVTGAGVKYRSSITVFREGQYRFPEYEKNLRALYMEVLNGVYQREISESEYLYMTSGVRFVTIRSLYNQLSLKDQHRRILQDMIEQGIFHLSVGDPENILIRAPRPLALEDLDHTRDRLIQAGIELFGEKGFYNVNVFEIARSAGFSVGTFYIYFPSKEAFLAEIVRLIGRLTRRFITMNLDPQLNRLETELQGMHLFLHHFSHNRNYYEIVREAEFVIKEEARLYYDRFERGYLKNLTGTRLAETRILANALVGLSHYLGIETFFSATVQDPQRVILELGQFMSRGIRE